MLQWTAVVALAACCRGTLAQQKLIINNLDREDLGVYFLGKSEGVLDGSETYCDVVSPGTAVARFVALNDSFVLRSADMTFRSRVSLYGHDSDVQPFKLSFHNIMVDDADPQPIELQHDAKGYLWIEPNHHVTHATVPAHAFVVRDSKSQPRFDVSLHHVDHSEL